MTASTNVPPCDLRPGDWIVGGNFLGETIRGEFEGLGERTTREHVEIVVDGDTFEVWDGDGFTVLPSRPQPHSRQPQRIRVRNNLHQGEVWIDGTGRQQRLAEMDLDHRRNLLAWVRRNAERLKDREVWSLLCGPTPNGDAASDCFDSMIDQIERTPAAEWAEDLPLVVRLRELVQADAPQRRRRALAMPMPAGAIRRWPS